jgi:hypothetical protein
MRWEGEPAYRNPAGLNLTAILPESAFHLKPQKIDKPS